MWISVRNWKTAITLKTLSPFDGSMWLAGHGRRLPVIKEWDWVCWWPAPLSYWEPSGMSLWRPDCLLCPPSELSCPGKTKYKTSTKETCHLPAALCGNKLSPNLCWRHGHWTHLCKSGGWQLSGGSLDENLMGREKVPDEEATRRHFLRFLCTVTRSLREQCLS